MKNIEILKWVLVFCAATRFGGVKCDQIEWFTFKHLHDDLELVQIIGCAAECMKNSTENVSVAILLFYPVQFSIKA